MKILLVSLVAALFISGKFAFRLDLLNNISENSNEIRNNFEDNNFEEVQLSENIKSKEFKVEGNKRSKKSYYPEPPCNVCGNNGNQFAHRPSQGYGPYQPNTGGNYFHPKPYAPSPIGPPRPYQHAPNPVYSAPVPSYSQPAYNAYNKYPAPVYQGPSNNYGSPHQHQSHITSSNLLVGCHPHVTTIPNVGYFPHYAGSPYSSPYSPPHSSPYTPPHSLPYSPNPQQFPAAYRSNSKEDSAVSPSKNFDFSNEMMPEKNTSSEISSSPPAQNNSVENNESNSAKKVEKAKTQQKDTLDKMLQNFNKTSKKTPVAEEKQKQSATKTDQVQKT